MATPWHFQSQCEGSGQRQPRVVAVRKQLYATSTIDAVKARLEATVPGPSGVVRKPLLAERGRFTVALRERPQPEAVAIALYRERVLSVGPSTP